MAHAARQSCHFKNMAADKELPPPTLRKADSSMANSSTRDRISASVAIQASALLLPSNTPLKSFKPTKNYS